MNLFQLGHGVVGDTGHIGGGPVVDAGRRRYRWYDIPMSICEKSPTTANDSFLPAPSTVLTDVVKSCCNFDAHGVGRKG